MSQGKQKPGNGKSRGGSRHKTSGAILKILGTCVLIAVIVLAVLAIGKVAIPVAKMYKEAVEVVEASSEDTFKAEQTSIVYDADGNEIKKLKGEKDVNYLDYDDIPDAAKLAIIAVEDKNYTSHRGIDVVGIARAVVSLIRNRGTITQGGSTITQQLARNIFLNFETTYSRKIKEIFIAIALEQKYTKEQILEYYLNNVYFANGYYGIGAASEAYFDKEASELTISQIAFLCAIPNSPSHYDPYENADATLERRDKILASMYEEGYISEEQYNTSIAEEITVVPKKETESNDYAETYIIKCATESLMEARGFTFKTTFSTDAEEEAYNEEYNELYSSCKQSLYTGGYRIYTSIDMDLQEKLQTSVSTELSSFTAKTDDGIYEVQGAAICIDNSTGRVVAIVGGREEDQEGYGLNRAYQSYRQPGSAIKPLLVYTPALELGYTPDSTLDDSRMTGDDAVSNAGYSYSGYISLRQAVMKSSNVATYRLYQELGPENCLEYLENLHFQGLEEADYIYDTTCLGGFTTGTTAVEMAAGYATLANDGVYRTPTCIVKITDSSQNIIVADEQETEEIYSTNAARMMTDVLESCVTESSATASNCALSVDMPVACKTGTTSDYVDGWLCGYSAYYTTVVWVGMDAYEEVDNLKGNTYPAYIWKNFMDKAHQGLETREFESYLGEDTSATTEATTSTTTAQKKDTGTGEDELEEEDSDSDDDASDSDRDGTGNSGTSSGSGSGSGSSSGNSSSGSSSGNSYDSGSFSGSGSDAGSSSGGSSDSSGSSDSGSSGSDSDSGGSSDSGDGSAGDDLGDNESAE
ncbi:MAG: PBP1A family penicillin-binding protein [Clostridiales bacterium]|nr:PBP1A family penicillin-binding protein [Clostridiales bacterium]